MGMDGGQVYALLRVLKPPDSHSTTDIRMRSTAATKAISNIIPDTILILRLKLVLQQKARESGHVIINSKSQILSALYMYTGHFRLLEVFIYLFYLEKTCAGCTCRSLFAETIPYVV